MVKVNLCPFCKLEQSSRRALIEHALEEIRQHTLYICSKCEFTQPRIRKDTLKRNQHQCWKENDAFTFKTQNITLKSVKGLLARQGITGDLVVDTTCRLHRQAPVNYYFQVDPHIEKTQVSGSVLSINPLPEVMLGQEGTPLTPPMEEDPSIVYMDSASVADPVLSVNRLASLSITPEAANMLGGLLTVNSQAMVTPSPEANTVLIHAMDWA